MQLQFWKLVKLYFTEISLPFSISFQMDPMFTPPAPGHPGGPGPSLPSTPSFCPPALPASSPKQLTVRTRSIGTNTQDGGISGALEGDPACLGPCQPGTSVNLEGIVWHETEEGQQNETLKECCLAFVFFLHLTECIYYLSLRSHGVKWNWLVHGAAQPQCSTLMWTP